MLKNIVFILTIAIALSACNSTLDDINKNPNATETPLAPYLLTGTLKQGADLYWDPKTTLIHLCFLCNIGLRFSIQSLIDTV